LIAGVDEEVGGRYGADYVLSDYGLKGDAALVLDSGPERLYLGASGIIWGKIIVEGRQGHAGYRNQGQRKREDCFPHHAAPLSLQFLELGKEIEYVLQGLLCLVFRS
jgi:acetylornithine deacetylase/succinyl-diaminopimelate desuccinylase-like protein